MRSWVRAAIIVATLLSVVLVVFRLRLSPDLSSLFPSEGEAAALARYTRAFGGGDLGVVLVRGSDAEEVGAATGELTSSLASRASVVRALDRAPLPRAPEPMLAWAYAGPDARARLAQALSPAGMKARLEETRALLLVPGSSDAEEWLAKDPLRLAAIPWDKRAELGAGVRADETGAFSADEGRARLVLIQPAGSAFETRAAAALVDDVDAAIADVRARHPGVRMELTGGHAVARATERMLRRDLIASSVVSTVLAALIFALTFRRVRALAAVMPPLFVGSLWTTACAAVLPGGLSAIAIAFTAVVVGVGVDTGVHVYAALLDARRRGFGPREAAREARRETASPTLTAAVAAGLAFAALALGEIAAIRQLGLLCALGEVLTAIAIVVITPEIGAWLERGPPPAEPRASWTRALAWFSATRTRSAIVLVLSVVPVAVVAIVGWPSTGGAIVAVRPENLAPLATQREVFELFGGRPGQWVVLSVDADADAARARADAIAEALEPLTADKTIDGYDALATFAPSPGSIAKRMAARDALDLPKRADDLEAALGEAGFDLDACAPALAALRAPAAWPNGGDEAPPTLAARHVAVEGGETLVATYVRPKDDEASRARALEAIHAADPRAVVTGYPYLEIALKKSLARDLPKVGIVALLLVVVALRTALRRVADVGLAVLALVAELGALGLAMRALGIGWHVYDALVVPVLLGVTIDESMFLLFAARRGDARHALHREGPLVASTALTTAAGFGALLVCRFEGLRDLGAVGALGVVIGLFATLLVVPCGVTIFSGSAASSERPSPHT